MKENFLATRELLNRTHWLGLLWNVSDDPGLGKIITSLLPLPPSPPLISPTLSPLCPAKRGLVQLFSPFLGLTEAQNHALHVPSSISQFSRTFLWKKFMGLILGSRMWFLLRSVWPQVSSSTKGVPLCCHLWVSPEHSLVPPALSHFGECPFWPGHNQVTRFFTKSYEEANRIQPKTFYLHCSWSRLARTWQAPQ